MYHRVEFDSILFQHFVVSAGVVSCPSVLSIALSCSRVLPRELAVCAVMWVERDPASNCRPPHSVIRLRECTATNAPRLTYEARANGHKRHSLHSPLGGTFVQFLQVEQSNAFIALDAGVPDRGARPRSRTVQARGAVIWSPPHRYNVWCFRT